ncbi:DUF4007 family protein [Roseovarius sp.]|uniref:DUF4007 family protein n=1 Tax=Roseovarius sp. TaxID=1486281 RepID=UPI00356A983F
MRWSFGGHETFVIREGWLHKGLSLLLDGPDTLVGPDAADALGVGQNMAKSIRYWLVVTGLAERHGGKRGPLDITALGKLIWDKDPYFLAQGTWWAIHIQLVNQPRAGAWCWFFNHFGQPRFERAVCIERLHQYLQLHRNKAPSRNTLERDMSCLLRCYATTVPPKREDPEDGNDCGLRELCLLYHFPGTGVYQRTAGTKNVPAELIGYNIALTRLEAQGTEGTVDLAIEALAREPGGPGAALQVNAEKLYELLQEAERTHSDYKIAGLGAERVLRFPRRAPLDWLQSYYAGLEGAHADAA